MSQEIPPKIESASGEKPEAKEQVDLEAVVTTNNDYPIDPKAEAEINALKNQIKYQQSPTAITNRKPKGDEQEGMTYNLHIEEKNKGRLNPGGKLKTAFMASLAGLMSLFATKEAKAGSGGPEDSLGKKPLKENIKIIDGIEVKEGLKIREVTPKEMSDWNNFIDFVESKGLKGSEKLDKGSDALARKLFEEYKKANPNTTISYGLVPSIQYEMQKLKRQAQGFAERRNNPNADKIMNFISRVDGWFGSQTSLSQFPQMIAQSFQNNKLVNSENLGLINGDFKPEKDLKGRPIPPGTKLEKMTDGTYYQDENGDWVKVS